MMKNLIIYCLLTICTPFLIFAQDSGQSIFDTDVVHEIRFEFSQSNFINILNTNHNQTPVGGDAPYIMVNVTIDGELVDSVGMRYKGFTSFGGSLQNKNPIKIDFNEFVSGKKYDGLRKLNLNNATADPAMQRDVICYDLLRRVGVSAPRTSYARVYYNDDYWGLFQIIEQVDKTFIKDNFSNNGGNLFKNLGWSKYEWLGANKNAYKEIFSLKTNEEEDDWSGFVNFVDLLNNTSDAIFRQEIENVFNVDLYLRTLVVDVATDNWDSYLEHGRNWYMYEDTVTNIFHWIPWDYNLSFDGQLGFGGGDDCFIVPEYAGWTDGSNTVKFLNTSFSFKDMTYNWDFGDGNVSTEKSPEHTYEVQGTYEVCLDIIVDEDCGERLCTLIDTEYSYDSCMAITNGFHQDEATAAFVATVNWEPSCCDEWGEICSDVYGWFSDMLDESGGSGGGESIPGFSIDQRNNDGILIRRLLAVDQYREMYYDHYCDLLANHYTQEIYYNFIDFNKALISDHVADDPNFLYSFQEFEEDSGEEGLKGKIAKRIAELTAELNDTLQHECRSSVAVGFGDLAINEIMASTDSLGGTPDPSGDYDDWIEIHNNTDEAIDLTDVYLSDSKTDLKKWRFPSSSSIGPRGYIIVWADKDEEQSGFHTNFKLSKSGDELKLSNDDGSIIDSLTFTEQETNVALARIPNGTGEFVFQTQTFGVNNEWSTAVADEVVALNVSLYPVPVSNYLNINVKDTDVYQYMINDIAGQRVASGKSSSALHRVDVSELNSGFYTLSVRLANGDFSTSKFLKLR